MNPQEFVELLERAQGMVQPTIEGMVVEVLGLTEVRAKAMIGREDNGWDPISPRTMDGFGHPLVGWIAGKKDLGFVNQVSATDPLLREGGARESIHVVTEGDTGIVGSDDKKLLWSEFGTNNPLYPEPARPIFAAAMMETLPAFEELADAAVLKLFSAP